MGQRKNIVDLLKRDHARMRARLDLLDSVPLSQLVAYFADLRDEIDRHETAEEIVVYPVFLGSVPDGAEIADACIAEHSDIESTLDRLDVASPELHEFRDKLRSLRATILRHTEHEETAVLPGLTAFVGGPERSALAAAYGEVRRAPPERKSASGSGGLPADVVRGRFVSPSDDPGDATRKGA
jgi:hypothetical protein